MTTQKLEEKLLNWEEYQLELKSNPKIASFLYGVENGITKEDFIVFHNPLETFAVLKDGKWYSKGDMGLFGISSNENTSWSELFEDLLKSSNPENTVTVIDCHI